MKICILTPRYPYPENGGDVLRINAIARHLKKYGNSLILVSFVEKNVEIRNPESLYDEIITVERKKICSFFFSFVSLIFGKPIQCGYYFSFSFLKKVRKVLKKESPDLVVCHLLRTSLYMQILNNERKTIVEMTDALSNTYSKVTHSKRFSIKKIVYRIERSRIKAYEETVVNKFPKVVLVSNEDANYLKGECKGHVNSIRVHSNGVKLMVKRPSSYNPHKICFIGNMRTLQNQEAVLSFVNNIFPIILEKDPKAIFYIVGAQPTKIIQNLASENIVVTGYVDDIYSEISDSCVAVAPVQIAAGIQNKVLIAMACGIPVVMSNLISKAIPELKNGENCIIEDDEILFAEAVISIIEDEKKRERLSYGGYSMISSSYSWEQKLMHYSDF